MLAGKIVHLLDFRLRHVAGKNPAHPDAARMYMEHDLGGLFLIHAEKILQNQHDKLHGGEIIIQEQDLEHRRWLQLWPGFLDSKPIIEFVIRAVGHLSKASPIKIFDDDQYSTG